MQSIDVQAQIERYSMLDDDTVRAWRREAAPGIGVQNNEAPSRQVAMFRSVVAVAAGRSQEPGLSQDHRWSHAHVPRRET